MYGPTKEVLGDDMKVKEREDVWHYFVHFLNWNARFDMWVVESDIYPDDEQSRELSVFILESIRGIKKASKLAEKILQAEETFWSQREKEEHVIPKKIKEKKQKDQDRLKELQERSLCDTIQESQIILSISLKKILVDEWEAITQLNLLPILPATLTVEAVLNRYLETKLFFSMEPSEEEEWSTAIQDLLCYFDSALPYLLYPCETLLSGSPRCIYSCQYLLRFCTKLPFVVDLEEKGFVMKVCDLLRYLTKNQIDIFQQRYKSNV